jgi:anti-sigma factor RsiW
MKCYECAKYLQQYVDGDLSTSARASFETHVHQCTVCLTRLEASLSTREALGCLKGIQQETEFTESVMTKIKDAQLVSSPIKEHQYTQRSPKWFNWRFLAIGAVAAAAALALGLPSMLKPNERTLAANIALENPAIQAAFGVETSNPVTIQNVIMNDGQAVVILRRGDTTMVVVGVDVAAKEVTQWAIVDHPISGT